MESLWITEPSRKTCLAEVTDVRGEWFAVDRALFAPGLSRFRHPQPPDKGTVWRDGEKRKLARVRKDGWLRLRDCVPSVGETLQCELDQDWRNEVSLAHSAMHLVLAAVDAPLVADPEVKGGGHARLTFQETVAPKRLAAWRERALAAVRQDLPISAEFVEGPGRQQATAQRFQPPDPVPGDDSLPLVTIPGVCAFPCDGTHVDRTGRIQDIVVSHAAWGKGGFVVGIRATSPA